MYLKRHVIIILFWPPQRPRGFPHNCDLRSTSSITSAAGYPTNTLDMKCFAQKTYKMLFVFLLVSVSSYEGRDRKIIQEKKHPNVMMP